MPACDVYHHLRADKDSWSHLGSKSATVLEAKRIENEKAQNLQFLKIASDIESRPTKEIFCSMVIEEL